MKCIGCGIQCRCALQYVANNILPGSKVQLTSELLGTHVRFEVQVQVAVDGPLSRYPGGQW